VYKNTNIMQYLRDVNGESVGEFCFVVIRPVCYISVFLLASCWCVDICCEEFGG